MGIAFFRRVVYDPELLSGYCLHDDDVRFVQSQTCLPPRCSGRLSRCSPDPVHPFRWAGRSPIFGSFRLRQRHRGAGTIQRTAHDCVPERQSRCGGAPSLLLTRNPLPHRRYWGAEGSVALNGEPIFQPPAPARTCWTPPDAEMRFKPRLPYPAGEMAMCQGHCTADAHQAARVLQQYGAIGVAFVSSELFRKIFPHPQPINGMIALPPLLGYPILRIWIP